jgi:hypothetical protein
VFAPFATALGAQLVVLATPLAVVVVLMAPAAFPGRDVGELVEGGAAEERAQHGAQQRATVAGATEETGELVEP